MKPSRLNGRKLNDYVLRKGHVWRGKTMTIRWLHGAPKHPNVDPAKTGFYMGSFASTKLDKSAVKRNRMRRRCREAFRIAVQEYETLPTVQLLLTPRSSSLTCAYQDIRDDVASFLSTLRNEH